MQDLYSQFVLIEVPADLETIIKYHEPSTIYQNDKQKIPFIKKIKLTMVGDGTGKLHPSYDYTAVVDRTFPSPYNKTIPKTAFNTLHQNNILVLVGNMINLEWNYILETYNAVAQQDKVTTGVLSRTEEALVLLKSLEKLIWIKENSLKTTDFVIKQKSFHASKRKEIPKVPMQYQKFVLDEIEKSSVLDFLINSKLSELNSYQYSFMGYDFSKSENLNSKKLLKLIDNINQPKTLDDLLYLFKKRVCRAIWDYIVHEMLWRTPQVTLNKEQGEYIYTVLLMFDLIKLEELLGQDSPRKKSNYISTFFKMDDRSKLALFPKISFNDFKLKTHRIMRHQIRKNWKVGGKIG